MATASQMQVEIDELKIAQRRHELIAQINLALSRATNEQEILSAVAMLAEQNSVFASFLAYSESDATGNVTTARVVAMQENGVAVPVLDRMPTDTFPLAANPILGMALETPDEPLFVENVFTDPRMETGITREFFRMSGTTATVIMWFRASGQFVGVMTFNWREAQPFNEEVRAVFQAIQPVAAAIIANRRLMLRLEQWAEASAQEANLYKTLVENSVDSILVVDLGTEKVLYANQSACRLLGFDYETQDYLSAHGEDMWADEDIPYLRQEVLPHLTQHGTWYGEIRQKRKDGSLFDASSSVFVIAPDAEGQPPKLCIILRDITERKQAEAEREELQQQVIEAQRRALQELSTPIIPIMDRIIVMPLVGGIDTGRSRDIMRSLLDGISRYRAQIAILDITGVPIVDSGVADHLNRTMQAARLKGAKTIITGVSDAVAETIVDLGIDWSGFETLRDLQTGLITALERLGIKLQVSNGSKNGNGNGNGNGSV